MKILYHHRIRSRDGQSVHLEELIGALRDQGHEVVLSGPEGFARSSFGYEPKVLGKLKRLMPKSIYELLEIGYNVPAFLRLMAAWRKLAPDTVYERYNLFLLAGIWLRWMTGTPLLLEVNAPLARERANFGGLGMPGLARNLERWVWRNADYVLPVTNVLAQEVRAAGVPSERIVVIPNAINQERFPAHSDSTTLKAGLGHSGNLVLGFTGFMRDWHGLDMVLDWLGSGTAPAHLHVVMVGDGPALPALKAQAKALHIEDRVTFTGLVERDAVARWVAAFDIALQPKSVEYASPLKLLEYIGLGKAIVAPDQPNIRELLTHEVSALLFDPAKPETLTAALSRLACDEAMRERLGKAAFALIEAKGLTWGENAKRVVAIAQAAKKG